VGTHRAGPSRLHFTHVAHPITHHHRAGIGRASHWPSHRSRCSFTISYCRYRSVATCRPGTLAQRSHTPTSESFRCRRLIPSLAVRSPSPPTDGRAAAPTPTSTTASNGHEAAQHAASTRCRHSAARAARWAAWLRGGPTRSLRLHSGSIVVTAAVSGGGSGWGRAGMAGSRTEQGGGCRVEEGRAGPCGLLWDGWAW
jgi:hypothetical protein